MTAEPRGPVADWQEMLAYVGFDDDDARVLRELWPLVEGHEQRIVDEFYDVILRFEGARRVFADNAQVLRLKGTLKVWLRELLEGPHDAAYWTRRRRIGRVHVRVGLPERYMFTAMSRVREALVDIARRGLPDAEAWSACHALARITEVELAVMTSTFINAHELQQLHSLQERIFYGLPAAVVCLDDQDLVVAATRPSRGLLGPTPSVGTPVCKFFPPEFIQSSKLDKHLKRARSSGRELTVPRIVMGQGLEQRTFRLNVVPLGHEVAEVLVHIEELTDAIQAEVRAQQAEALAKIGALAANVAHEIRNPLAAISATLQVIGGSMPIDDRRGPILEKVQEQVARMDRLVVDLLSFSRPAAARLQQVQLAVSAAEAVSAAGVQAELHVEEAQTAWCDHTFVGAVLINLLQNARAAAGPTGRVCLELVDGPALRVCDDGPGVPAAMRERIFEPFVTSKAKGTGLGLAISRKLADSMGGRLELLPVGSLGGATFVLHLQSRAVKA